MPLPALLTAVLPSLISEGASVLGSYLSSAGDSGGSSGNAFDYLNKIFPMAQEQFNPYIQRGNEAQNLASTQYNRMSADPMDYLNQIISGYRPSTGYKFREKKALEAARNSAAAGGFSGTRNDQMQQAEMAQGLSDQSMQEWLNNVLNTQGIGLSGQQRVADTGYNASQSLADILGQALGSQSGLAYEDQKERRGNNQALMGGISNLIGTGVNALANRGGRAGMSSGGMPPMRTQMFGRGMPPIGTQMFENSQNTAPGMFNIGRSNFGSVYGGGRG